MLVIPAVLIEWVPAIGGLVAGAGLWGLAMYTKHVRETAEAEKHREHIAAE